MNDRDFHGTEPNRADDQYCRQCGEKGERIADSIVIAVQNLDKRYFEVRRLK